MPSMRALSLQVAPWERSIPTALWKIAGVWWHSSVTSEPAAALRPATTGCTSPEGGMRRMRSLPLCSAGTPRLRSWQRNVSCREECPTTAVSPSGSHILISGGLCLGQCPCDCEGTQEGAPGVWALIPHPSLLRSLVSLKQALTLRLIMGQLTDQPGMLVWSTSRCRVMFNIPYMPTYPGLCQTLIHDNSLNFNACLRGEEKAFQTGQPSPGHSESKQLSRN